MVGALNNLVDVTWSQNRLLVNNDSAYSQEVHTQDWYPRMLSGALMFDTILLAYELSSPPMPCDMFRSKNDSRLSTPLHDCRHQFQFLWGDS